MWRAKGARFALRHPDDSQPLDARDAALAAARRREAFAVEDKRRSIAAPAVEHARFYSMLAHDIAALPDPAERDARLTALGFLGLPVRVEVEMLRLLVRTPSFARDPEA